MKRILVVYHSQEKGNTRQMAELVAEGCRQVPGVEVSLINVNEARVNMDQAEQADAYALGTPDYFTYMAGGLKQFFDDLCLANWAGKRVTEKAYVAFLTHGGGGGGIKSVEQLAQSMKLVKVADSLVCRGAPSGETVEQSRELGKALAQHITAQA
jgi:NAD(P)H dehydrogenase (quinone)